MEDLHEPRRDSLRNNEFDKEKTDFHQIEIRLDAFLLPSHSPFTALKTIN